MVRCAVFVVSVVYVERGHMPSPWSGHRSRQGEWSGVLCLLCALFMWRKATHPLHTALSIALDKENGQVRVLCLLCALFMWREVAHGHCSGHALCDL